MTKAMGEDEIPPKLTKTVGSFLAEPLADIINFCFSISTFADLTQRASVTPTDKGGNDKHIYSNYRPVSVLNSFYQLLKHANEFLQTFIGAYRKLYCS